MFEKKKMQNGDGDVKKKEQEIYQLQLVRMGRNEK